MMQGNLFKEESKFKRILICGGRHYDNKGKIYAILDRFNPDVVICGGATGADSIAMNWCKERGKINEVYYADSKNLGKMAGPARNSVMANKSKPDLVIAFNGGKGTDNMVKVATKMGIQVADLRGRR
jgi:predicted Rossmann-fold nucleotide-binding protein